MLDLIIAIVPLVLLALLIVLLAFRRHRPDSGASVDQSQRLFFRQRQRELLQERDSQLIDDEQYQALELDLERQLLDETPLAADAAAVRGLSGWWRWLLILALLAASLGLYFQLGGYNELALYHKQQQLMEKREWSPQDFRELLQLTERGLRQRPEHQDLLLLAARLQMQMGEFDEAAQHYAQLVAMVPESAALAAQYAQSRYLANQRRLDSDARAQLQRALELDPAQPTALGLLGIEAIESGKPLQALDYWQRLQRSLPAGSPQLATVLLGIQRAKQQAFADGQLDGIVVEVSVDEQLVPMSEGWLYVVARGDDGMPMPVAVARVPVRGEWPVEVLLTDSDAMTPSRLLSQFDELRLSARVSRSGKAMPARGDLQGSVVPAAATGRVQILIDSVVP